MDKPPTVDPITRKTAFCLDVNPISRKGIWPETDQGPQIRKLINLQTKMDPWNQRRQPKRVRQIPVMGKQKSPQIWRGNQAKGSSSLKKKAGRTTSMKNLKETQEAWCILHPLPSPLIWSSPRNPKKTWGAFQWTCNFASWLSNPPSGKFEWRSSPRQSRKILQQRGVSTDCRGRAESRKNR